MTVSALRRLKPIQSDAEGNVLAHYAKYAKSAVITAFEDIGGQQRFSDVADSDPKWFYEKCWIRMIPREHDVQVSESVDDLLRQLDAKTIDITPRSVTEEPEE